MTHRIRRLALTAALLALAGMASAHTGHGTHGLVAGLEHPLAADHLLAMLAVGLWSAAAAQARQRAFGPLAFVLAMTLAAALGAAGVAVPWIDSGIAISVVLMGALLVFARRLPLAPGLVLVALAGALHGLAHGSEIPAGAGFAAYAMGFVLTTALLHTVGLVIGASVGLRFAALREGLWRFAGSSLAGVGLLLLVRA